MTLQKYAARARGLLARDEKHLQVVMGRDEAELRRAGMRVKAHLGILALAIILINVLTVVGAGDQAVLYVSWLGTGAQEFIDYFGKL